MLTHRHVQEIARRIAATAHLPVKVIVFGSYGCGDATEDSDLDLLVIEREVPEHTAEYLRLREAVGPVSVGVDPLLMPQAEFDRRRDWASGPVYWAAREARVPRRPDPANPAAIQFKPKCAITQPRCNR